MTTSSDITQCGPGWRYVPAATTAYDLRCELEYLTTQIGADRADIASTKWCLDYWPTWAAGDKDGASGVGAALGGRRAAFDYLRDFLLQILENDEPVPEQLEPIKCLLLRNERPDGRGKTKAGPHWRNLVYVAMVHEVVRLHDLEVGRNRSTHHRESACSIVAPLTVLKERRLEEVYAKHRHPENALQLARNTLALPLLHSRTIK
jgi:hypothetical protein